MPAIAMVLVVLGAPILLAVLTATFIGSEASAPRLPSMGLRRSAWSTGSTASA